MSELKKILQVINNYNNVVEEKCKQLKPFCYSDIDPDYNYRDIEYKLAESIVRDLDCKKAHTIGNILIAMTPDYKCKD